MDRFPITLHSQALNGFCGTQKQSASLCLFSARRRLKMISWSGFKCFICAYLLYLLSRRTGGGYMVFLFFFFYLITYYVRGALFFLCDALLLLPPASAMLNFSIRSLRPPQRSRYVLSLRQFHF